MPEIPDADAEDGDARPPAIPAVAAIHDEQRSVVTESELPADASRTVIGQTASGLGSTSGSSQRSTAWRPGRTDVDDETRLSSALTTLTTDFGAAALGNPERVRAGLSDLVGKDTRRLRAHIDALALAAGAGIPVELATRSSSTPGDASDDPARDQRLVAKLADLGVEPELAAGAVAAWAAALDGARSAVPGGVATITPPPLSTIAPPAGPPPPPPPPPAPVAGAVGAGASGGRNRRRRLVVALAAAAALVLVAGTIVVATSGHDGKVKLIAANTTTTHRPRVKSTSSTSSSSSTTVAPTTAVPPTTATPPPTITSPTTARRSPPATAPKTNPVPNDAPKTQPVANGDTTTHAPDTSGDKQTVIAPAPGDPMVANNDSFGWTPNWDSANGRFAWAFLTVYANDTGPFNMVVLNGGAQYGWLYLDSARNTIDYQPAYNGYYTDSFSYYVYNSVTRQSSAVATVYVTVYKNTSAA